MKPPLVLHACAAAAVLACAVHAEDQPDPDLPQPFDEAATQQVLMNSPFTRTVNLEDSLRLTGIAYVGGKPVATLLNKQTKQSLTVSDEPNEQGIRLTEARPSDELDESAVTLQIGEETVTMHYGDEQLSPGAAKKGVPTSHLASSKGSSTSRSAGQAGSEGDRLKASSYLSAQAKALYESLSSSTRSKFKDIIKSRLDKHPDMTTDQLSSYADKIVSSLKKSETKAASGATSVKVKKSSSKPSKVR